MENDFIRVTLLALIQGITEFLPISSSAHLILPSAILGWDDQGLAFDVAVHFGTLSAVLVYFRKELTAIVSGCLVHVAGGKASDDSRLGWMLLIATVPVIVAGFLARDQVDALLREAVVIAVTTVLFALLLYWADRRSGGNRQLRDVDWKTALVIGLAQVLALIPGTSRSGITMTAAMFCNLDRTSSSRFSFLLSIPVIAGATLLLMLDLMEQPVVNWGEIVYATAVAGITAFACIHFFLRVIERTGFLPFVIYRLLLGAVLFLFFV